MKPLSRTPLYEEHVAAGAKLVDFADYLMPVHYPAGIKAEHNAVRSAVGLFDVSHMGEFLVRGPQAFDFVQYVTTNDVSTLRRDQAQYTAVPNAKGNLIDDILVYHTEEGYLLVVNAANREKDWKWLSGYLERFDVELVDQSDATALLALQGPRAAEVLARITNHDLDSLGYYRSARFEIDGRPAFVSRTGYTGEDGFEIYADSEHAVPLWRRILEVGDEFGILPAGLGARDTLRLEMGYPLYGNELTEDRNPFEAGLGWVTKVDKGDFVGRMSLLQKKAMGIEEKLIGFRMLERGFPRVTYQLAADGTIVGGVTSGTVSPTLGYGIGFAYVTAEHAKVGTKLDILIRNQAIPVEVVRLPFYTDGSIRR